MMLLKKVEARGQGPSSYAPISRALNKLSDNAIHIKFHFIASKKRKYSALCELEAMGEGMIIP